MWKVWSLWRARVTFHCLTRSCAALLLAVAAACGGAKPSRLAPGSAAPDFSLPGVDGRTHALREYADGKLLAVVFTGTSCPASQLYETRIQKLHDDYRAKGVAVVAINPNNPAAMQPVDLAYSDVGEKLDDMKARAAYRRLTYTFLTDSGQAVAKQFMVTTTPHVFVFDQARTLRYDGRIDDDVQEARVKSSDASRAIDALLAGGTVPVSRTPVSGCPVNGLSGSAVPSSQTASAAGKEPVVVDMAGAEDLKRLRQNGTGKLLLINFWATWCVPCAAEFPDLEATYRMYKGRNLEFTAVSVNDPAERPAVLEFLQEYRASHRNLLFSTSDVYGLQAAFDPAMPAAVPFTLLLAPNGDVMHQELGELDVLKLRRAILRNLPDDPKYPGLQAYWSNP
jgi:thiol-disulfide isomerase/thioredoxin